MNDRSPLVDVYRHLQRLYPRSFRREYGPDMVELFRDQLADEGGWRVCTRAVVDLFLTVPASHVEVHMHRKVTPLVILLGTAALAGVTFALFEGLAGILVAIVGTALAVLTWKRDRPAAARRAAARWWIVLATGVALLALVIVSTTITGELGEVAWLLAAIAFLTSFVLIAAGSVLAFLQIGRSSSDLVA